MSQYKLSKNTNTELWVIKLRENTNAELGVNINYGGTPTPNYESI